MQTIEMDMKCFKTHYFVYYSFLVIFVTRSLRKQ